MTEATTVDQSGVTRTADGTIAPAQVTSDQNTTQQTTTETKEGSTLLNGKTEPKVEPKKDATKAEGAPEKYEDYKLAEGLTLAPEVKTKVDTLFKGLGLNQAQAQSLIDFYGEQATASLKAPFEAYKQMTDSWAEESKNHPDLRGKLGPGQEVNVRIAKALDGIGDAKLASDFRELMDLTGAGNHPAFIRVLDHFARRVTEGSHVAGNGPTKDGQSAPGKAPASAAAAIWPNLPSASR
jgi:hypothetical protein